MTSTQRLNVRSEGENQSERNGKGSSMCKCVWILREPQGGQNCWSR